MRMTRACGSSTSTQTTFYVHFYNHIHKTFNIFDNLNRSIFCYRKSKFWCPFLSGGNHIILGSLIDSLWVQLKLMNKNYLRCDNTIEKIFDSFNGRILFMALIAIKSISWIFLNILVFQNLHECATTRISSKQKDHLLYDKNIIILIPKIAGTYRNVTSYHSVPFRLYLKATSYTEYRQLYVYTIKCHKSTLIIAH